jgi:hypothetical protein
MLVPHLNHANRAGLRSFGGDLLAPGAALEAAQADSRAEYVAVHIEVLRALMTHTLAHVHACVKAHAGAAPEVFFALLSPPLLLFLDPRLPFDRAMRAAAFRVVQVGGEAWGLGLRV